MKTIYFKFRTNDAIRQVIDEDSRICSAMRRYAFNRIQEGVQSSVELNNLLKERFNCNSILRSSARRSAMGLYALTKDQKKVHFGKFKKFQRGLITKEEYKDSKNTGVWCEGECNYKGNRLFQLDVKSNKHPSQTPLLTFWLQLMIQVVRNIHYIVVT